MLHPIKHFRTVSHHRWLVLKYCFRIGLYKQGLLHDLSKFSPTEFWAGAKYYQGNRSPNDAQRLKTGYSAAWLHHKGRNRHHLEYWIDYSTGAGHQLCGMEIPPRYVAEMICDRIAASRTYRGGLYSDSDPYEYYMRSRDHYVLHPKTRRYLETYLKMLKDKGERETLKELKMWVHQSHSENN